MQPPRIRGGFEPHVPYPLSLIPREIIEGVCKRIVHLKAVGFADMTGDEWSRIFADAIGGQEYPSPLGVADVAWNGCCWSVKTIKQGNPHRSKHVRLISGRNNPDYSAGISDPRANIKLTGQVVLQIYNQRIEEARSQHDDVRLVVLMRNMTSQQFTIFERDLSRVETGNYAWRVNARGNLEAFEGNKHAFTWQPHGSQFTILEPVPEKAIRFRIKKQPPTITIEQVLRLTRFQPNWVEILGD